MTVEIMAPNDMEGMEGLEGVAEVRAAFGGNKNYQAAFFRYGALGEFLPFRFGPFHVEDVTYYHRVNYPAAGAAKFKFFREFGSSPTLNVSNWIESGLPDGEPAWLVGMGFAFEYGHDVAGANVSGAALSAGGTTVTGPADVDLIREVFEQGAVYAKVGKREFGRGWALSSYPTGRMFRVAGGIALTTTTKEQAIIGFDTGDRQHRFGHPIAVMPGKPIHVDVEFPAAYAITAAGVLRCELYMRKFQQTGF